MEYKLSEDTERFFETVFEQAKKLHDALVKADSERTADEKEHKDKERNE